MPQEVLDQLIPLKSMLTINSREIEQWRTTLAIRQLFESAKDVFNEFKILKDPSGYLLVRLYYFTNSH